MVLRHLCTHQFCIFINSLAKHVHERNVLQYKITLFPLYVGDTNQTGNRKLRIPTCPTELLNNSKTIKVEYRYLFFKFVQTSRHRTRSLSGYTIDILYLPPCVFANYERQWHSSYVTELDKQPNVLVQKHQSYECQWCH